MEAYFRELSTSCDMQIYQRQFLVCYSAKCAEIIRYIEVEALAWANHELRDTMIAGRKNLPDGSQFINKL